MSISNFEFLLLQFENFLSQRPFTVLQAISEVSNSEDQEIFEKVFCYAQKKKILLSFLESVISTEIDRLSSPFLVFRENKQSSSFLRLYFKLFEGKTIKKIILPLQEFVNSKKIEFSDDLVEKVYNSVFENIKSSIKSTSPYIRRILRIISEILEKKFPSDYTKETARSFAVSSVFFLRIVCPEIIKQVISISPEFPSEKRRVIILISKILQCLSSQSFLQQESEQVYNRLIERDQKEFIKYCEELISGNFNLDETQDKISEFSSEPLKEIVIEILGFCYENQNILEKALIVYSFKTKDPDPVFAMGENQNQEYHTNLNMNLDADYILETRFDVSLESITQQQETESIVLEFKEIMKEINNFKSLLFDQKKRTHMIPMIGKLSSSRTPRLSSSSSSSWIQLTPKNSPEKYLSLPQWIQNEFNSYNFVIVVAIRGDWCSFCKAAICNWNDFTSVLSNKNGMVFGIAAQNSEQLESYKKKNNIHVPLISDVSGQLSSFLGFDTVDVKNNPGMKQFFKIHQKNHFFIKPSVVVYNRHGTEMIRWQSDNRKASLYGTRDRLRPAEIMLEILRQQRSSSISLSPCSSSNFTIGD